MTEIEYITCHFEENFSAYKGSRIALSSGEYLDEIIRLFDHEYHFACVLEPDSTQVPENIDVVILTDRRTGKEPDYNRIWRSCEEKGVLLVDLFGLDQIALHRELRAQEYLSIPQWKELLSDYEIVTILVAGTVVKHVEIQERWILRPRFMTMYDWLMDQGKTVLFLWDSEDQTEPLRAEYPDIDDRLIRREGNDQGFLQLALRYKGRRAIHIGIGTARDGIIPREYGMDSRMFRFDFPNEVSTAAKDEWYSADRESLEREIGQHDIISFDIFDTLLKRTVLYPKTVFEIVEERTGIRGFADSRYEIQTAVPQSSMDEIYDCLKDRCSYDDEELRLLRSTELQIERDVIMPRRSMIEMFEYAKAMKKTVVLISDMYLEEGFIRTLLERSGIEGYDGLYLSYRYKKLKQDGLFEELLLLRETRETILHIGDNYYSDCISAQEFGIDAFYVPSCLNMALKNGYEKAVNECRTLAEQKLLGLSIAMGFDDPFALDSDSLIANMVVAPLAMGYLHWICGRLTKERYDHFLLSSRDGWIMLEAYDRLRKMLPDLPEGRYFYISRHAAFLTVMDDIEKVKHFGYLSYYEEDPPTLLQKLFNLSGDELLPYRGETPEEYYNAHEPQIRSAAERYRQNYLRYMENEGLSGSNCAIMDFVSEGRSQRMLEKLFPGRLNGYYIGLPEYATEHAHNISYYFERSLMDYDTEMKIEVYFTSMEPALNHFDCDGRPVFDREIRTPEILERIEEIHSQVRKYLDRYINTLYDVNDAISDRVVLELCKSVNNYEAENCYYDDMTESTIKSHG